MWNPKNDKNSLIHETETDSLTENRLVVAKRGGWERDGLEGWSSRSKPLYTEWINTKVLRIAQGIIFSIL